MDKKTTGIIATAATAVLCGCPGLGAICFGGSSTLAGIIPGSEIDIFGSSDPGTAVAVGLASLCVGVIGLVVPVVVGFATLRKTEEPVAVEDASDAFASDNASDSEDIPPAS